MVLLVGTTFLQPSEAQTVEGVETAVPNSDNLDESGAYDPTAAQASYRAGVGFPAEHDLVRRLALTEQGRRTIAEFSTPLTLDEETEFRLRLKLQEETPTIVAAVEALGTELAGFYLDQKGGGMLVLQFTSPDPAAERTAAMLTHQPERLRFETVEHSGADLRSAFEAVTNESDGWRDRGIAVVAAYVDPQVNAVRIVVEGEVGEEEHRIVEEFGGRAIFSSDAVPFTYESGQHGGDELNRGVRSNPQCSVGVSATNYYGWFVLTAGHCGAVNTTWFHANLPSLQGHTPGYTQVTRHLNDSGTGNTDIASISVPQVEATQYVKSNLSTSPYGVRRWYSQEDQVWDTFGALNICKSGYRTGVSCGQVIAFDALVYVGSIQHRNYRIHSVTSDGGDSGGSVFGAYEANHVASALGTHVGRGGYERNTTTYAASTRIGIQLAALNANLYYG